MANRVGTANNTMAAKEIAAAKDAATGKDSAAEKGAANINNSIAAGSTAAGNASPSAGAEKSSLFREKSLERIENPEKLNDYLRVTNPGVWLVLATVIVLLAGVCIWGIFGRITATSPVAVVTQGGESLCLVPQSAIEGVIENRIVIVDGKELQLSPATLTPEMISDTTNVYTMLAGDLSVGDIVYPIALEETLADEGVVAGTVVTEKLSPVSLFFGK